MNIEMQVCGLVMLVILLVIMLREKSLDLSSRSRFIYTMVSCIVCVVMDILSVIAIVMASNGTMPEPVTLVICKLYLVFLVNVGYRNLIYVAGEFLEKNTSKLLRNIYRSIFVIGEIAIIVLPINIYCDGRIVYSYGPSTLSAYGMALVLLVSTMSLALLRGRVTSRRRKRVIVIWQMCWVVGAFIQFLRPDLLVISFAASIGLVLVYAELENPNEGIDRVTGQFTYNELYDYVIDLYRREQKFSALHLGIDYSAGKFDLELELTAMRRVAYFLEEKNSYVFRESDRDFVVIYKTIEEMQADYDRAVRDLKTSVDLPINVSYVLIPDSSIFRNADEFMQYQHFNVKDRGHSDTVVAGRSQAEEMHEYLEIRDKINWALANDGVDIHFQPIYNVHSKAFTTAEVLTRLRDSDGEYVMPARFIPIAEENGLIIPLGMEVFRKVCEFLARGEAQELGVEYLEINLSMAQFNEDEPAGFIQELMDEYGVDPAWINLEITETADPKARQIILKNMQTLIDRGISFSLDDFGTGRSNVDYFMAMPVDIVKFDYKFTHWYFESEKAKDIVESIVGIIRRMDIPMVMEGIETKEELDAMIGIGASYIQGYYFSKPVPEDEFLDFLRQNS